MTFLSPPEPSEGTEQIHDIRARKAAVLTRFWHEVEQYLRL